LPRRACAASISFVKLPLFLAAVLAFPAFAAEIPRALPPGELPKDARLGPLKELDGYFPFTPPETREAWEKRAEEVRMQLRVALGVWPEPTRTPLNAVVHGGIERDDYTVEKIFFESMPGFFVTGNLYRPRGMTGPFPAVLCPHGHWNNSRFWVRDDAEMKKELESGGEVLSEGGRSIFQALGVQLARMGIVAFVYDMIGYCDAQQISYDVAHKFAKQRPEMNTRENWGLFSPQAEAHAQSIMGLQTWNSIRALDFLTSLPDVDAKRLGCTGASGGGTQTMMLAALDPRLAVACPAVMVSTAMQGGCTCENASLLRVGTGNVEIAALFAPKPQGMTTAKDWTVEMPTKGFPELQKLYALMGAPENVALWPHPEFPHNYNSVTRHHIYRWFNTHFHLGLPAEKLTEREYPLLKREQLTVWSEQHPAPAGGDDFERKLLKWWHDDAQAQLAKAGDATAITRPAWQALSEDRAMEGGGEFVPTNLQMAVISNTATKNDVGWGRLTGVLRQARTATEIPLVKILAADASDIAQASHRPTVLWLDERGKAGLFADRDVPREEVLRLRKAGWNVVGADLFGQGEFLADGQPMKVTRRTKNPREAGCYTFGYNPAVFAERVRDIGTVLAHLKATLGSERCAIAALDGTGPLAAVVLAVLPEKIDSVVIQTAGFRFGGVLDLQSPDFLPAAAKYGDLPGALSLARKKTDRMLVLGEGDAAPADPVAWLLENAKP
jgi:dienelactone hydrolase